MLVDVTISELIQELIKNIINVLKNWNIIMKIHDKSQNWNFMVNVFFSYYNIIIISTGAMY